MSDLDRPYIKGLNGLRAVAVCTVFLGHAFPNQTSNAIGVDIFFVLSGFLITRGLYKQLLQAGGIDLRDFYVRRIARLFPALALVVLVLFVLSFLIKYETFRFRVREMFWALIYLTNYARMYHKVRSDWLGHTWSLSIEEQFYLLWPLFLLIVYKTGGRRFAVIGALCVAAFSAALRVWLYHHGASQDRLYFGFDTRIDGLLLGCTLAVTRPKIRLAFNMQLTVTAFAIYLLVFIALPWESLLTLPSISVSFATLLLIQICWSDENALAVKALEMNPANYLGKISYGLYLWHWPILVILRETAQLSEWLCAILAALATMACAALSYHLVEKPILRWAHRSSVRKRDQCVHAVSG